MCAYEFDYFNLTTKHQHAASLLFCQSSYTGLHAKPLVKLSGSNPELIDLFRYLNFPDNLVLLCLVRHGKYNAVII